ncbi:MAG: FHA domain-containing protein [Hyphomicrobiaceae bacterium]
MTESDAGGAWLEAEDGRKWPLDSNCPIGRSPSNTVVLNDRKVSRRHAVVHRQDVDEFLLVDLGSGNGSYVNGRRVSLPVRLSASDVISVGDVNLTFHRADRSAARAATRAASLTLIEVKSFDCWMLLADIIGSTRLALDHSAENWARLVGSWAAECRQIIELHGGTINKYLGDGFLAIWPEQLDRIEHVVGTVEQFLRLQQSSSLPFRVVLHAGGVSSGGGRTLGEDNLSGVELIFLFRMEKLAASLGHRFLVSEAAHQQLDGRLPLLEAGAHEVPGFVDQRPRAFFAIEPREG